MMAKFNVGDKVRILDVASILGGRSNWDNGDIVKVTKVGKGAEGDVWLERSKTHAQCAHPFLRKNEFKYVELVTPQYKTEKRRANVGERILIVKSEETRDEYKNGDVATVSDKQALFESLLYVNEWKRSVRHTEYEVIVETPATPPKPKKSARITALESQVAAQSEKLALLQAKVEALEAQSKPAQTHSFADSFPLTAQFNIGENTAETALKISEAFRELSESPNQERADVIKRAQAFVGRHRALCGRRVSYVVNADKRTVVALVYRVSFGCEDVIYSKGIAKCDPDDVFNADIGKAIALARALNVDVPVEFVKAIQPTEVVVGMVAEIDGFFQPYASTIVKDGAPINMLTNNVGYIRNNLSHLKRILDDSNAVYE